MRFLKASIRVALFIGVCFSSGSVARATLIVDLDFSVNTSLPSAQGMTYVGGPGSVPEATAYTVSGGLLHLNTIQFGRDVYAYYEKPNSYVSSADGEIITRLKVDAAGNFGISFDYYDASHLGYFTILKDGWVVNNGASGPAAQGFLDTSVFHVYDLKTFASTLMYQFSVDGTVVASGAQSTSFGGPPDFFFGDGTPSGGNVTADISYLRYYNGDLPTAIVPEPASLLSLGSLTALSLLIHGWRRRRVA